LVVAAGAAVANTGISAVQGAKAARREKKASAQAMQQAADTKAANERATNAANAKSPNLAAIFGKNMMAGSNGVGSTMLTGPGGVPTGTLSLGKNTLLGQ
jgi:hypothetical protein